ncbi:ATP-dependent helicase [Corynebacterium sp.]|uniref:ATP-dependent helicase n=1 Tax=Corynebacterium sp. TaxID=1720 RepID=UPI0026DCEC7C|nr:UvrD-helicase domain-containing protein [Corynebacterium sp.]MDO5032083.1 UvrD-helicase domain-containing protein [Corynebacterium sp.]
MLSNEAGERAAHGTHHSPEALARALGKKFPPTAEQAVVIDGPFGPKLVVAGAGAGKTETMASRVVSLVANGHVRPEQVLGLTFTRKAAQQLEQRIRRQLTALRESGILQPGSPAAEAVENIAPVVSTYDSYAGELVREYGLLMPVEPSARIITEAERYAIAHEVVHNVGGELSAKHSVATVTKTVLALAEALDSALMDTAGLREHEHIFRATAQDLDKTRKNGPEFSQKVQGYLDTQRLRLEYLPLVEALKQRQAELGVITFGEQMSIAATLAQKFPLLGRQQSSRYTVVMLDEYQDTSHAQRILLRSLFGGQRQGLSVTAVGDPMQAIYGWRGATAENLAAFVEDFPQEDGTDAPKDQLTTSWRNPVTALALANDVAADVFSANPGPRPVDELSPRAGAPGGDVQLAYFASEDEERAFVAERLRALYDATPEGEEFSAAVLVRTNRQAPLIAAALDAAGVPNEIVGVGGLLWQPEVQDLIAVATILVRPQDTNAALRVLTGPMCGIGLADIQALHARQRNLAGAREGRVRWEGGDPMEHLRAQLEQLTQDSPDQVLGLADALADLGERERYTPEGLARMEEVAAKLRHLRTYSLGKSMSDIFADIEALFTIRTEVLATGRPGGATHLDAFADLVAGFHGDSLYSFLDYLQLARDEESGLTPGEVPAATNRVQIMTVHKSKGLEWEHVCVVHADSVSYKAQAETFLTKIEKVPGEEDTIELPPDATKRSEFGKACETFLAADREHQAEEAARLFYVAMTRTESTLTITGSGTNKSSGKAKKGPYRYLELLAQRHPELVVHWEVPENPVEPAEGSATAPKEALFPSLQAAPRAVAAAEEVLAALEELPAHRAGETFEVWEREASALIEEYTALQSPVVEVELPSELTASDMVALSADPVQFARRQRRPVPFKPNAYAKRGTAFHAWLEERFGAPALLSEDELPGMGEEPGEDLAALKQAFLDSPWAQRTPQYVEAPFEITIGDAVVRGRMDAVFREPDGTWFIIDWKTGRPPRGAAMRSAEIQLAVYAEAWRRIHGVDKLRAAFYYVQDGYLFEPRDLPTGDTLAQLLDSSVLPPRG